MSKESLIKKFEDIAEVKNTEVRRAGLRCACGKCNLAKFSLKEILKIIEEEL